MGSIKIWIAACFAYAALSAAVYLWVCYRKHYPSLRRRTLIAFAAYLVFALLILWLLWAFLGH